MQKSPIIRINTFHRGLTPNPMRKLSFYCFQSIAAIFVSPVPINQYDFPYSGHQIQTNICQKILFISMDLPFIQFMGSLIWTKKVFFFLVIYTRLTMLNHFRIHDKHLRNTIIKTLYLNIDQDFLKFIICFVINWVLSERGGRIME